MVNALLNTGAMGVSLVRQGLFVTKQGLREESVALKGIKSHFQSEGIHRCHFTFSTFAPRRRVTANFQEVLHMSEEIPVIIGMNIMLGLQLVINLEKYTLK